MISNFLETIKGQLVDQLARKTELNPDKLTNASGVITDTLREGLLDKFKQGRLDDIVSLLGKRGTSSSFANSMITNTIGNLASKMGLPKNIAAKIANIAIPFVIEKLGSFASEKGKNDKEGIKDLLGDLLKSSAKDKLLGGLGKKFGF